MSWKRNFFERQKAPNSTVKHDVLLKEVESILDKNDNRSFLYVDGFAGCGYYGEPNELTNEDPTVENDLQMQQFDDDSESDFNLDFDIFGESCAFGSDLTSNDVSSVQKSVDVTLRQKDTNDQDSVADIVEDKSSQLISIDDFLSIPQNHLGSPLLVLQLVLQVLVKRLQCKKPAEQTYQPQAQYIFLLFEKDQQNYASLDGFIKRLTFLQSESEFDNHNINIQVKTLTMNKEFNVKDIEDYQLQVFKKSIRNPIDFLCFIDPYGYRGIDFQDVLNIFSFGSSQTFNFSSKSMIFYFATHKIQEILDRKKNEHASNGRNSNTNLVSEKVENRFKKFWGSIDSDSELPVLDIILRKQQLENHYHIDDSYAKFNSKFSYIPYLYMERIKRGICRLRSWDLCQYEANSIETDCIEMRNGKSHVIVLKVDCSTR